MKFIKHFILAFFGQIIAIVVMVILLEVLGIEAIWSILLVLYISVADWIIFFLTGKYKGASEITVLISALIPLVVYSILISLGVTIWKKYTSRALDSN